MTEDEMVGWHHQLDGHEFEQTPGVGDGQGSLACCSPWGHKGSDTAEHLNWRDPPNTVSEIPLLSSLCISLFLCIYLWSFVVCVCVCVCVCVYMFVCVSDIDSIKAGLLCFAHYISRS